MFAVPVVLGLMAFLLLVAGAIAGAALDADANP
jgi:hypothetical protein